MDSRAKAVALAEYLRSREGFVIVDHIDGNYCHMGATIADAILQAGINYDAVVRPRVKRIREAHPAANTISGFWQLLREKGTSTVLSWKGGVKPKTVLRLTEFFLKEGIESERDLREWIGKEANRDRLLEIKGIGQKTVDYIAILVGGQTAAVDRHVKALLLQAGIQVSGYDEAREILNLTADMFHAQRAVFDHSVWRYMSLRRRRWSGLGRCENADQTE